MVLRARYHGIGMNRLLPNLTARLNRFKSNATVKPFELPMPEEDNDIISQSYLWPRVGKFFKSKDVLIAETGTSNFGLMNVPLPDGAVFVSQILWGSIGYTTGATLGAALAARELGLGRTILFIGDGSLQLTVQELSTMILHNLKPIIFVLNNRGYTIERWLHGKHRKYNDVVNWNYTALLDVFSNSPGKTKSYSVSTKGELDKLLSDPEFASAQKMQLVEIHMDKLDAPIGLMKQAELSIAANHYS